MLDLLASLLFRVIVTPAGLCAGTEISEIRLKMVLNYPGVF